jgi:hypothetical protein
MGVGSFVHAPAEFAPNFAIRILFRQTIFHENFCAYLIRRFADLQDKFKPGTFGGVCLCSYDHLLDVGEVESPRISEQGFKRNKFIIPAYPILERVDTMRIF